MTQANNPLHGKTLEAILNELVAAYGWAELGSQIAIRCFTHDPSVAKRCDRLIDFSTRAKP